MADQGFPGQHTTTTVTSSNTTVQTNIRYDPLYIRTIPGMLKVAQIVLNLLGFICITISYRAITSRGTWFNTVAMGGFWFTGILLALYLFHVIEKCYRIPWLKILGILWCGAQGLICACFSSPIYTIPALEPVYVPDQTRFNIWFELILPLTFGRELDREWLVEFVFCSIWTFFYLLAASLAASDGRYDEAFGAAAFFGFVAMVAYGCDAFLKFNAVRSGALAQGERVVTKSSSTVTSPAY